jgi:DNA replication protein DnaC
MKDFKGPEILLKIYTDITDNLSKFYQIGASVCFSGQHGVGKSFTASCIIKKACQKNYHCTYTTLTDVVNALVDAPREDRSLSQRQLTMSDFVVLDEVDPRFFGTDAAADMFGKTLEHIFRTRSQNKLPTIFCTNSPNPVEAFSGSIKQSIDSLMSKVKIIPIMGKDFRKGTV